MRISGILLGMPQHQCVNNHLLFVLLSSIQQKLEFLQHESMYKISELRALERVSPPGLWGI